MNGENGMRNGGKRHIFFPFALLLACLVSGCAHHNAQNAAPIFPLAFTHREMSAEGVQSVFTLVEERNRNLEDNPNWINQSYRQFLITDLGEIGEQTYADYRKYLDDGAVYIIVHPAYYPFFDNGFVLEPLREAQQENAVELFLQERAFTNGTRFLQYQERVMRDVLEYFSTQKKLVVLVLPGDYAEAPSYRYAGGIDEYMRYINEVTNQSESVLYLFSRKFNSGRLRPSDRRRLAQFLTEVSPRQILIGGGYLGRCVDEFSRDFQAEYENGNVFLVPEITAWSPSDMAAENVPSLLRPDGTVDVEELNVAAEKRAQKKKTARMQIRNLNSEK